MNHSPAFWQLNDCLTPDMHYASVAKKPRRAASATVETEAAVETAPSGSEHFPIALAAEMAIACCAWPCDRCCRWHAVT